MISLEINSYHFCTKRFLQNKLTYVYEVIIIIVVVVVVIIIVIIDVVGIVEDAIDHGEGEAHKSKS